MDEVMFSIIREWGGPALIIFMIVGFLAVMAILDT